MSPSHYDDRFPQTAIVKSNLNDYYGKKNSKIGKPQNLGQKQLSQNYIHGVRNESNEWNAKQCLYGRAT